MSLGGQGLASDASPAVITYGPDGTMYGSPAQARAAGVDNPTYQPPAPSGGMRDLPPDFIPLPGPDFSPMPNPPSGGKGGADPYSQMGYGSDPYSQIMSQMPIRQNPYGGSSGGALGGYNPSLYNNAFMGSNSRLNLSGLIGGGSMGGGGGGGDYTPTPSDWDNMTNSQKAAFYAENPNMASVTRGLQTLFGNTLYGKAQNYFNPGFVSEQRLLTSVDPVAYQNAKESFRASEIAAMNAGYPSYAPSYETGVGIPGESYTGGFTSSDTGVGNPGESYGGPTSSESGVGNPGESYGGGGTDYGSSGFGDYFKGGLVNSVGGSDPAGPDEGQVNIMRGEYVIKKSAVKKYGQGLLDMINDGKIPAKKMKSLLG